MGPARAGTDEHPNDSERKKGYGESLAGVGEERHDDAKAGEHSGCLQADPPGHVLIIDRNVAERSAREPQILVDYRPSPTIKYKT